MGVGHPVDLAKNQRILPEAVETDPVRQDAIRQALERVLSSSGFARNERLSGFLRFLVERHLEGRDSELKESVIAHEVFGRKADYDPKLDAIVRTEAVRLRARLEKYYQADGSQDPWIIDLPKGGYRPVVRQRLAVEPGHGHPAGPAGTGCTRQPDPLDCRRRRGSRARGDRGGVVVDAPGSKGLNHRRSAAREPGRSGERVLR